MPFKQFMENNLTYREIYESLQATSKPHADFYILMLISAIIATFGLLMNSPAVIIGAMLVSPLMDPILGIALGSLYSEHRIIKTGLLTLVSGVVLAISVSYGFGLLFALLGPTDEILVRSKPTILDMFVALAAGFLGAIVKIRKNIGGTIYGVAIAIALMPPLCVIGLGFAFQDNAISRGSALLFLTNLIGILFSGLLAFMLISLPHQVKNYRSLLIPAFALLILAIPLTLSFRTMEAEKRLSQEVKYLLKSGTLTFKNVDIANLQINLFTKPILITVTVRAQAGTITPKQVGLVQAYLQKKIGKPVELDFNMLPITQIKAEPTFSQ